MANSGLRASFWKSGTILTGAGLLSLAALTGCAPNLGPAPQIQPPATYETAKSLTAPATAWPEEQWWKAYGDPQLDSLIDEALKGSPDLKMAAARVRGREGMADISEAMLWPTIVGDGALMETQMTENLGFPKMFQAYMPKGFHHAAYVTAGMQYQLDLFGKNHAAFEQAMSTAEAAKADEAEARLQISAGVAQTYAMLMQLFSDKAAADDAVQVRQQSVDLVEKRLKSGLENEASLSQARALLEAAKVQAEAIDGYIARARHALAALVGKGPDYGLTIVPTKAQTLRSNGLPTSLAADLIGRRPDVVAARRTAEAAAQGIEIANANFYPNVDLTGLYGLGTLDAKLLFNSSSQVAMVGPAIHLPIFDYGRNTGIYRASRAKYDAAVALYDKTLTNALRDVADAYSNRRTLEAEIVHARAALAQSENAYRVLHVRYEAGLARYLDVLTAENILIAQRTAVADFEAQAFAYDIVLVRALGGGYVEKK
jgi:NodT family efflux transporter outer membrane factor (OMF) lipoprotein